MPSSKPHSGGEHILSFEEARQCVCSHANMLQKVQPRSEALPLLESLRRILAEDILSDRDLPPFPRATRDGYALNAEDTQIIPSELKLAGQIRAGGDLPPGFTQVKRGQAISIMTGAPVPVGANAVLMIEHSERLGDVIRVPRSVVPGENVVPRGSEASAGSVLINRGTRISYPPIALAAALGKSTVRVYRRPRIAILPTGDEVVPIDSAPANNQIRNSNSFSLAAQVIASGGEPIQLAIAPDEAVRLRELIAQGLECDLLLLSGGVSAGEFDLVEDALSYFSAEILFTGVQIQPGKPLVFGRTASPRASPRGWTYFFGLPGNPISTMVTFELFASTPIQALSGVTPFRDLQGTKARLVREVRVKTGLTRFLPARLSGSWDDAEIEPIK